MFEAPAPHTFAMLGCPRRQPPREWGLQKTGGSVWGWRMLGRANTTQHGATVSGWLWHGNGPIRMHARGGYHMQLHGWGASSRWARSG
jgi:hypothetical protein